MTANPHSYGDPLDAAFGDGREAPAAERDPPYLQSGSRLQDDFYLPVGGLHLILARWNGS